MKSSNHILTSNKTQEPIFDPRAGKILLSLNVRYKKEHTLKPNISETSYGYALTDELIHRQNMSINSAPIFPTLYQEGQDGARFRVN